MIQLKHFLHTFKPKVNFYSVTILKNNHMQMNYMKDKNIFLLKHFWENSTKNSEWRYFIFTQIKL